MNIFFKVGKIFDVFIFFKRANKIFFFFRSYADKIDEFVHVFTSVLQARVCFMDFPVK